ncbi:MAG: hypothetical protein U5L98_06750 [Halomonas sp.]|nr:hypothetical protein [Halomonas sp.]MDZ7852342.1 hypothetical protein [Halomonas sp.]
MNSMKPKSTRNGSRIDGAAAGQAEDPAEGGAQQAADELHEAEVDQERQQDGGKEEEGQQHRRQVVEHHATGEGGSDKFRPDLEVGHQREQRPEPAHHRPQRGHVEQLPQRTALRPGGPGGLHVDGQHKRQAEDQGGDGGQCLTQQGLETIGGEAHADVDGIVYREGHQEQQHADQRWHEELEQAVPRERRALEGNVVGAIERG